MSEPRPFNSEELGDLGETRFSLLCKEGVPRLIVNQCLKDMSGWDFIVEFPSDPATEMPSDARKNPISARFQAKAMWIENDRIKFNLSSLERLAKDPKPSFVCALKFDHNFVCRECYIIHFLDENLAFVLQKLREASLGEEQTNHIEVSMYASKNGRKIEVSHNALVNEIERCVGGNIIDYVKHKAEQLDGLGFQPKRFDFSFAVPQKEAHKMSDALLGLGGEIAVESFEGGETRFGIRRPLPMITGVAKLTISPAPIDTCKIRFYSADRKSQESVPAVIYAVPPSFQFDPNYPKLRFSSKTIDMIIGDHNGTISVKDLRQDDIELTLNEWAAHFRIVDILITGGGRFDVVRRGKIIQGSTFGKGLKIHGKTNVDEEISVVEKLIALRAIGSLREDVASNLRALDSIKQTVLRAHAFLVKNEAFKLPMFLVEWTNYDALPEKLQGHVIDYIKMDDDVFAFVTKVIATKKSKGFEFEVLPPQDDEIKYHVCAPEEYSDFVDNYRDLSSFPLLISSEAPTDGD